MVASPIVDGATEPFGAFADLPGLSPLRQAVVAACRRPEPDCVAPLLEQARLPADAAARVAALARRLVESLRRHGRGGGVEGLIHEYALSSEEGVALMCLAEALLRIPDAATRDALIRDKIAPGDWAAHLGHSPSPFVNAATWGLLVTGRLVATGDEAGLSAALTRLIARGGEPLIRGGVDLAVRVMGEQFVTGRSIAEALRNATTMEAKGFTYSYDMLGEAAVTAGDAARYLGAYDGRDPGDRRGLRWARRAARAGDLDQAVGAPSALCPFAARARPDRAGAARPGPGAPCQGLRHRPQHRRRGGRPARPVAEHP